MIKTKKFLKLYIEEDYDNDIKMKVVNSLTYEDFKSQLEHEVTFDTPKDKLYFVPGCKVPRIKVREMFNCAGKIETSTHVFINPGTIETSENLGIESD